MIVFGKRLYGKVDLVPGLFYVATNFVHIWYVPLVPLGSNLIIHEDKEGWQGMPLGLSFKSFLVAWLRGASIAGAVIFAIFALGEPGSRYWIRAGICAATFVITKWAKVFTHASPDRARELAERVGLSPSGQILLDLHCGEIDEDEAVRRHEALPDDDGDDDDEEEAET